MENIDDTTNEKPKGNMLQNENREDEATPEDSSSTPHENITKKVADNTVQKQPQKKVM